MIRRLAQAARKLDLWLQDRIGRPYHVILCIGLISGIVSSLLELPGKLITAHGLFGVALPVAMYLALLINQIGSLSEHFERRDSKIGSRRRQGRQ